MNFSRKVVKGYSWWWSSFYVYIILMIYYRVATDNKIHIADILVWKTVEGKMEGQGELNFVDRVRFDSLSPSIYILSTAWSFVIIIFFFNQGRRRR